MDKRLPNKKALTYRDVALLCGHRPMCSDAVLYLSPYEFVTHWEPVLLQFPRSLAEDAAGTCHAALTAEGIVALRKRAAGETIDLQPGVHYLVREQSDGSWIPFDDRPATAALRHTRVLQRRRRPPAPTFYAAPLPHHGPGQGERNALITMTYFHPWTLCEAAAVEHVPHPRDLKNGSETWQEALQVWLEGRVLCQEARRYKSNFIAVHRVRPTGDEDAGLDNSDDLMTDEELEVTADMLPDVLGTRQRGTSGDNGMDGVDMDSAGGGVNSAMSFGADVWQVPAGTAVPGQHTSYEMDESHVKEVLAAAVQSRKKESSFAALSMTPAHERAAAVTSRRQATAEDVADWLRALRGRVREDGSAWVNEKQFECVRRVAERVQQELRLQGHVRKRGRSADDEDLSSEPLRWILHGGPGTGKSHVVRDVIIKELLEGVLQWTAGLDFQAVALQAVMADLLQGDTIHHACGIPVQKRAPRGEEVLPNAGDLREQFLHWRRSGYLLRLSGFTIMIRFLRSRLEHYTGGAPLPQTSE